MRKEVLLFSVILLFAGSAASNEVYYEMDVDSERILMNTTVKLDCEDELCPNLRWNVPEDAELLSVTDSEGESKEYELQNGGVIIQADDRRSDFEMFKMAFSIDRRADEVYDGLYKRRLSLRSFEGAETTGNVRVEDLLSTWSGYGVETSVANDTMHFRAEGPLNLRVKFGNGYGTEYYEFFGGTPGESSLAYEVAVGTTGQRLGVKRLPIAILPDDIYNETVSRWSSGEYRSGSAKMRQGLGEKFRPVLAHETVHALNDRDLNWDQTSSSYFEEGTSSYVEFLVKLKLLNEGEMERPVRELFGESVRYDPDESDRYYKTLPPNGRADVLWGYYQNDYDYMKNWDPFEASSSSDRRFGYAYSELMIRNYVVNGNGTLRDLYDQLEVDGKISDTERKWDVFSEHLDMTPCRYETRERFDQCLKKINDYEYSVYTASPYSVNESGGFTVEELEVPEREEKQTGSGLDLQFREDGSEGLFSSLISLLYAVLRQFFSFLGSMF